MAISHRARRLALPLALLVGLSLAGCEEVQQPEDGRTEPSAACDEAFAEAAEAGERADVEEARSPDLDLLEETLEACGTAEAWTTAVKEHRRALPLEMDRETALDLLCQDAQDTPVCQDWQSSGSGAGTASDPDDPNDAES